jgi:ABC-type multidrug transport system fused ATPase/permease subunit
VKNVCRGFAYLRPYAGLAVAAVLLIVVCGLAELLTPWPLKILVDHVLGTSPLPPVLQALFGTPGRMPLLLGAVAAGLAVALVHNLLHVADNYVHTTLEQRMVLDFRSALFEHAQHLSLAFHDRRRAGTLIYAINSLGDAVAGMVLSVPALVQSLITLAGMFWIVFWIDRPMALLALVVVPFLFASVRYYAGRIEPRLLAVRNLESESLSIVHEAISMLRVIVAFGREEHQQRRFRRQAQQAIDARVDVTVRQTAFSLAVNVTTAAGTALVLGLGAQRVLAGRLTVGDLLVVMAYIAAVYKPLEAIAYTVGALQERIIAQKMAFEFLDTEPEVQEAPHARTLAKARGKLVYEAVDFAYQGRHDTLTGISLAIQPGQTVAIVGPTGAGKTTLVSLLPRFYDPQCGRILLDDIDIRDVTLRSLRNQISIVLQEPLLFSGTVAENIRYGRLEASDDEVVQAARSANAHDFISRLPNGYQTELGERGAQLSGGERQRLCIARAFLKDAPLLILDEPTSAIDSQTESVILEALDRLVAGRTSILIAHRLSTVRHADAIFVLNGGRLVQSGTHASLRQQPGLYRELVEMQSPRPCSDRPLPASE